MICRVDSQSLASQESGRRHLEVFEHVVTGLANPVQI